MYKTVPDDGLSPPPGVLDETPPPEDILGSASPQPQSPSVPAEPSVPEMPEGEMEEESNATPEEQRDYDTLVTTAMTFIYGKGKENILKRLRDKKRDPAMTIGNIVSQIGVNAAKAKSVGREGERVSEAALLNAADEVVALIVELGQAKGVLEEDPNLRNRAFFYAVDAYKRDAAKAGLIDEAELAEAGEVMRDVEQKMGGDYNPDQLEQYITESMAERQEAQAGGPPVRKVTAPLDRGGPPETQAPMQRSPKGTQQQGAPQQTAQAPQPPPGIL